MARNSSFCPGVGRALRITEETLARNGRTFSLGPLIHNPAAVERLRAKGLVTMDPDHVENREIDGAFVIIRSHGIDTITEERLTALGAIVVDATCPTVKRAQEAARKLAEEDREVLVIGKAEHPEVRSIVGRTGSPVTVVENREDAVRWVESREGKAQAVGIVCQTTIPRELLESVIEVLEGSVPELVVRDTLCEAVMRRRQEAIKLSGTVDLMIVVGGGNSSNTARLAEGCAATGVKTKLIENAGEIEPGWLDGVRTVGITGGASTPRWQLDETVTRLNELSRGLP